jgi:pimeloyl-ACP methyl ester carboxylesterase
MAQELRALLSRAKILPPYVLVGHSLGGTNVRLFSSLFPESVAGLVLVDAADDPSNLWSLMPPDALSRRKEELRKIPEGIDFDTFVAGTKEAWKVVVPLGDKPLVVLSRGLPDAPPSASPELATEWLRRWQEAQSKLPPLSSNSVHVVARNSRHTIQADAPKLVVAAIREVVGAVRARTRVSATALTPLADEGAHS